MTTYKVLSADQSSHHGGSGKWRKNQWRSVTGEIVPCVNGIHYCQREHLIHWLGPTIWVFEDGSPDEAIDHGDKMVTRKGRVIERLDAWNETTARLFAADVAEIALVYIPESHRDPFVAAINAARGFARGETSNKELAAARDAAWAARAARDAARAAGAAAWADGDAAWAAGAAAWAAGAAGAAAGAAARAAAGAAARAAGAAAGAAARAAGAAAGAVARNVQTEILFDYLEGRKL